MTIQELYNHLNSPEFQNTDGNIFYNYYIYQYDAKDEYNIRKQIEEFQNNLKRPTTYINAMLLDLFSEFCNFLKMGKFGDQTLFDTTLKEEEEGSKHVVQELSNEANSDAFIQYINKKIAEYISQNDGLNHPYIFVYGIGKMYPFLRTNVFLTKYEKYNETSKYKIILFYPGQQEGNSFSLFNKLNDTHTYRSTLLVNKTNLK